MATVIAGKRSGAGPIAADMFEKILAGAAAMLLLAVIVAVARGTNDWSRVPALVWLHLLTISVALTLTPPMLLRRRGDRLHRRLGTVWLVAMLATALSSFGVRTMSGGFSFIHLLSIWTLIQVPLIWWSARTHNIARHRSAVRGMVTGALLVAGFFTFPFDRLLGRWLFG